MSERNPLIIGSVFERKPAVPSAAPTAFSSGKTGFPAVQHRSKSAFARRGKKVLPRHKDVPDIIHTYRTPKAVDPDEWRKQIGRENQERVEGMTEEEREEERKEIVARFGAGVGDLLKRVQQARDREAAKADEPQIRDQPPVNWSRSLDEIPITSNDHQIPPNRVSPPPPALSTSSTRPPSRADRRLRFAELSTQDVHVYESAPPSPRRKALALPPPPDDGSAVSLGQWKGSLNQEAVASSDGGDVEPEEGSAEYIRRRYFPDAPANDPNLAWMEQSLVSPESEATSSLRFDLTGKPVPPSLSSTLPTHLGLHHHAEGEHAGYTLDDVFLLSRSSVPAQRATMLGVLVRIARRVARLRHGEVEGMDGLRGKEEELRTRIVAAGVEAMSERGSVGARAIEVIWQCVVGWDEGLMGIEGVELEVTEDAAINSLPLDFILPQIATSFAQGELTGETMLHLLGILYRLALHSNVVATSMATTPKLIPNVVQAFLLTPIPATDSSSPPNHLALELLTTLVKGSRSNAAALQDIADALLRFVTMLPPTSPYPDHRAISLLISTLRFYTALASYGFYSHIASTAMTPWTQLMQYILSETCTSRRLMTTWTELLETWMVCAVDPHRTTPTHEILWSQIVGWGWQAELGDLSTRLGVDQQEWDVWAGVWRVQAAWLEGSRVNAVRGGSSERAESINILNSGFEDGKEKQVVLAVISAIHGELSKLGLASVGQGHVLHLRAMAGYANTLAAAIRLWLACLPPLSDGPLDSPPFFLPFSQLSELCAKITVHPLWSSSEDTPHIYVYHRPLSGLLSCYLQLSRRLPGISQELWVAQSLAIVCKLLPGDEDCALQVMEDVTDLLTNDWTISGGIQVPSIVWERGGMSVIKPFLSHTLRPRADIYIGPLRPTPRSIMLATTQRLPPASAIRDFGLPACRDWTLSPLDHLLRSGSSAVFKSLPASWDASETEVTRVSLLLTNIAREVLDRFSLADFVLTREEATFGCMKVFMLEHGQPQSDSAQEVFRDQTVGQFMEDLMRRYTIAASRVLTSTPVVPEATCGDLEKAATRFLGKTPFYQYYTDFLALYDAISFSHPLFARLLLPPTSMRYAIDYRRHLWSDYAHLPKTIRIPVDQVICQDIRDYLWPIESDAQMIGHYLRSLLKDALQGFVHLVALHHVASNVWQDIHDDEGWNEDRASKLLAAVVEQGSSDVVRQVVRYQQRTTGECLVQPRCFGTVGEEVKVLRLQCLDQWGGQVLVERLKGVLDE